MLEMPMTKKPLRVTTMMTMTSPLMKWERMRKRVCLGKRTTTTRTKTMRATMMR